MLPYGIFNQNMILYAHKVDAALVGLIYGETAIELMSNRIFFI